MTHRQWGFQTYDGTQVKTINDVVVIGEQEGGLYKLKGHPKQALIHDIVKLNEPWHRRLAHVHYRALPMASKAVPKFQREEQKSDYDLKKLVEGCEDPE